MKKLLAMILAAMLLLSLVACGGNNDTESDTDAGTETDAPVELAYKSATELLALVWAEMDNIIDDNGTPDDTTDDLTKSYFVGGMDAEGMQVEGTPGEFVIGDGSMLDFMVGYPQAEVAKIDNASSLIFMMNQNTFTCGAYHFTNAEDISAMVNTIESNIQSRMWMCGFPEKVVIIKVPGDYLISLFGHTESFVDPFVEKVLATIDGAEVVLDNPIA